MRGTLARLTWNILSVLLMAAALFVAGLVAFAFLLVHPIPNSAKTLSAITATSVRIEMYVGTSDKRLPPSLEALPKQQGHANRVTDGWDHPLIYAVTSANTFTLTSLGGDGLVGGTGDDADVVVNYRLVDDRVEEVSNEFVNDWRRGDGICALHDRRMNTQEVNGLAGHISFLPEYYEAKEKLFPNGGIEYGPNLYSQERGLIYVCPDCKGARDAWRP